MNTIYTKKTNRTNMPFFMSMAGLNVMNPIPSSSQNIQKQTKTQTQIYTNDLFLGLTTNKNISMNNPGSNFTNMFDRVSGTTCGSCPSSGR